jgi:integrase
VWSARERKPIRKTFRTLADARAWRQESQVALRKGLLRSPSQISLREAADEWLAAAEASVVRTRSGEAYKPSAIRGYRQALNHRALPLLGSRRLTAISHTVIQDFADRLCAQGLSPSSVRNTILPLRAIYRRAHARGEVAVNPTVKLSLPAVRGMRERVAAPTEVTPLLDALPPLERAIFATALYAGLRLGELQALQWDDVDLTANLIHLMRNWDRHAGFVAPKSRSGNRRVPIFSTLRRELLNHRLQQGKGGRGFVFPNKNGTGPFNPGTVKLHTNTAWTAAGLQPIGLHECRHSYAAYMIAAGINTKALSTYMGHSSITITLDRYGHLLPGNETDAAIRFDAWLERATAEGALTSGRLAVSATGQGRI